MQNFPSIPALIEQYYASTVPKTGGLVSLFQRGMK